MNGERILAVGDSHAAFFGGLNQISTQSRAFLGLDILHLGAATAHNIANPASQTGAAAYFLEHLNANTDKYGCLILSLGEIDCRVHIVRSAIRKSISIEAAVLETVERYFAFAIKLRSDFGIPCLFWGPIASAPNNNSYNPAFPTVGSLVERNYASHVFNRALARACQQREGFGHFTVFDHLIRPDFSTKSEYLFDGCHLSNILLPMAEQKLRAALTALGLERLMSALDPRWPIKSAPALRNVAIGRPYVASSQWDAPPGPIPLGPDGTMMFHTDIEDSPSIVIDLDSVYPIHEIVIHNRASGCEERARSIAIALSLDGANFADIHAPDEYQTPGNGPTALRVRASRDERARFVKVYLRERDYFHLDCVEVLALSFLESASRPSAG